VSVVFVRAKCCRRDSGRGMSYLMTTTVVLKKESDCAAPDKSASLWLPANFGGGLGIVTNCD
jgi:hypothetical protein